jgi:hypothetical protein
MSEQKEYVQDSSSATASKKKKMLKWEYLARIDRGPLQPSEKLNRARFGNGWLVKYEFAGGSHKSGCSLVYVDDPQGLWIREVKMQSKIINSQQHPSQFLVIRQFDAQPGSFLALAAGTRSMFWTQLLFVQSADEEQQSIVPGVDHDQNV